MDKTEERLREFLTKLIADDVTDFGYLLIPNDHRLNSEAVSVLREKWRQHLKDLGPE